MNKGEVITLRLLLYKSGIYLLIDRDIYTKTYMTPEHKIGNNEEAINQTEKGFQAEQVAINIKTLETLNMNLMRKLSQLPEGAQEILEIKAEIARNNASIDSVRNIENAKDKRYEVGLEESFSNPLYWGGKNK